MLHQQEILSWLKMFNVSQIKHFLTIKSAPNLEYIERITSYNDFKPKNRMTHGYSEKVIMGESKTIYLRDQYRYKSRKEEKIAIDEIFLENITASRSNPYALSVKKQYIRNGKLSECMLVLSDHQIFNSITANYQDSAWFKITTINSFSMWLVRAFQLEIFHAYYTHESVHAINRFMFAEECLTREKVKKMLEGIVGHCLEKLTRIMKQKGEAVKLEEVLEITSKEEGAFLLQRCLDKLEEKGRDLGEIVFEQIWAVAAECDQKVYKIFRRVEEMLMVEYSEYIIDVKCKEIESLKNSSKRKKKVKKTKEVDEHSTEHESKQEMKEEKVEDRIKEEKEESPLKVTIINQPQVKPETEKQKRIAKLAQTQKKTQLNSSSKKNKQNSQNKSIVLQQKDLTKTNEQKQKQQQKKTKKIIHERINQYILNFYQQIYEASQNFDKYRKICYEILQNTIQQLKIPEKWSLQLFGSASINFALKQSDLDLVLILDSEKSCTLNDIYQLFKVKEWLRECNLILATKVPIVEFEVLLSQIKHPKIKENKKILNTVIHVDISISYRKDPHEGIKNSIFLKEIFENHPNLMTICLILKELLRVNGLNKPYKGGIGSYVLVILAHNILKLKNIDFCESFLDQMKTIAKYLTTEFQPFATLITPFKNSKIKPNSELSLNIQDPHEKALLHTSARLINEIIILFKQLHLTLQNIEQEMSTMNLQQRKKMKRIFFQNWNILFKSQPMDI